MLTIEVPGYKRFDLEHLVLDFNGTIAFDGKIIDGVKKRIEELASSLKIHVLTADSFGSAHTELIGYPCKLYVLEQENQEQGKLEYIQRLGCSLTVCIGNGQNDRLMLKEATLGICICMAEGAATGSVLSADILCPDILSALDLLIHPQRLMATLRT